MNIHKINIFFLLMLFLSFQSKGQMRVALVKTDCKTYPNQPLCTKVNDKIDLILDSLSKVLDYTYIKYNTNTKKENLILASFTFEERKHRDDFCIRFTIKDAFNDEKISSFCAGPVEAFPHLLDLGVVHIKNMLSTRTVNYLDIKQQQYFENVILFFEFNKIHFQTKIPKKIKKEVYRMIHNICVQQQIHSNIEFNFVSKYSNPDKIRQKDDTKLYVAFEPNPKDKNTCKVTFYLKGEGIIDMYSIANEKLISEVIVNLDRIKKRNYTELLSKLHSLGIWIFVNR